MVLVSHSADAIPYSSRVLGEDAVQGAYVQTGVHTWVDIRSVRDSVITYHCRHLISEHEMDHYMNILCTVFYGYYFDNRFTIASMDDPRIRMSIITFLECYGDIDNHHPEGGLVDDLVALEALDDELWARLDNVQDEDYRPDVTEVVDLTYSDDEDAQNLDWQFERAGHAPGNINWDEISLGTISLLSGFDENERIDWNIIEAFEPPTEFEM